MKIAIVGAGISGLVAAYHLQDAHQVTVFEAGSHAGGHTNTVSIDHDGDHLAIDVGFVVFNDWTYPEFIRLLGELGVVSQPTTMSFSVRDDRIGLEYNGHSLNTLFAQRKNLLSPRFYGMLRDILRFNRAAPRWVETTDDTTTVGEFLARGEYSPAFVDHYLLPMGAAIWSCPTGAFADFPVRFVAEFYRNHGLLSLWKRPTWRVVAGGAATYVRALTRGFRERIRLNTPIQQVVRNDHGVVLVTRSEERLGFDHVIFACHSDQALRILGAQATPVERSVLSALPYQPNVAVLHTDQTMLPRNRRAWASWNYRATGSATQPATVTYNMNLLQRLHAKHTYCVTLNDATSIAPQHVLRRFEYHHPVFTTAATRARARHRELIDRNRTSFCGAYWRNGFHEDGVVSALAVVEALRAATSRHSFVGPDRASRRPELLA